MTAVTNISNSVAWQDTTELWSSAKTWVSFGSSSTLVNAVTLSSSLSDTNTGISWQETTDTWETSSTWASYTNTVSSTNTTTSTVTQSNVGDWETWGGTLYTWGEFLPLWGSDTYPWLLSFPWLDTEGVATPYTWAEMSDYAVITNTV